MKKDTEFIESEKKRIVESIDALDRAIGKSEQVQPDIAEFDIDRILERRRPIERQRSIDINRSHYYPGGYYMDDKELYEQVRVAALEDLLTVIKEEISLKKEKPTESETKEITLGGEKNADTR
jgi:hypothetical protein